MNKFSYDVKSFNKETKEVKKKKGFIETDEACLVVDEIMKDVGIEKKDYDKWDIKKWNFKNY